MECLIDGITALDSRIFTAGLQYASAWGVNSSSPGGKSESNGSSDLVYLPKVCIPLTVEIEALISSLPLRQRHRDETRCS